LLISLITIGFHFPNYEFKGRCITNDLDIGDVIPITITDVALSFLVAGPAAESDRMEKFIVVYFLKEIFFFCVSVVKETAIIFDDDVSMMEILRTACVKYIKTAGGFYLRRAHVVLKIDKTADFPPSMLETLFWLRWAGSFNSQIFRESVLVVGPTGCKTEALRFLLSSQCQERMMSRETQVAELIGWCVLCSAESSNYDVVVVVDEVKTALGNFGIDLKKEKIEDLVESVECITYNNIQSPTEVLKRLFDGDLFMGYKLQCLCPGSFYLRYPKFLPVDLVSCLVFKSPHGWFQGPLNSKVGFTSRETDFSFELSYDNAIRCCKKVLEGEKNVDNVMIQTFL
jgi:hypothetical protein